MKNLILLILLGLSLTSKARAQGDFFIFKPEEVAVLRNPSQNLKSLAATNCRDRISQIICLVDSKSSGSPRQCQAGGDAFAAPIEKIYDILPEKVQKVFCGLNTIFIEDSMESLAYAGVTGYDANSEAVGAVLGIRRILVEQNYDATSVLGWKEQKTFGIVAQPFVHVPEGPRVDISLPVSLSSLHYILAHELGHILDFANKANGFECPAGQTCNLDNFELAEIKKLTPKKNSWSELSWKSPLEPKAEYHFPLWDKLCVYGCSTRLELSDMESFYSQLVNTNFVTTYSAISAQEDFAESFAFYLMTLQGDWSYRVQTPQMAYPLETRWQLLKDKTSWMETFYNGNLKYPRPSN